MSARPSLGKDSVVVLLKAGRLPAWHRLTPDKQRDHAQEHVDLMLSVAREHRMMRLEGFKLIGPQQPWERFWTIEFPSMEGAEAWIHAEMAPPYGSYGHYEYYLARRWGKDFFSIWVTRPPAPRAPLQGPHPHRVPVIEVDRSSVVILLFGRGLSEFDATPREERGDAEHIELMHSVAREHGLMRLEAFSLVGPQPDWHRAWIIEFPTLAGAEAWIDAEVRPPYGSYRRKTMLLARKWAPDNFAAWAPLDIAEAG